MKEGIGVTATMAQQGSLFLDFGTEPERKVKQSINGHRCTLPMVEQ